MNQHHEVPGASELLAQSATPVTVFTLSWCSFCHAVKQLLRDIDVPHTVIELDTGIYRAPEVHNRLRQELRQLSGSNTLPQVFIGSIAVGGYTDTQAALRNGKLKTLLAEHQISLP
ncbi:MAG: glutaredoxin [Gammaproteobacteria bacterium]|nr:glutaredoxin [Gammaproteobacteria bacterium]